MNEAPSNPCTQQGWRKGVCVDGARMDSP